MTPPYSLFEASLGNPFVSHSIFYKVIPYVISESMIPNLWSCCSYVQEKFIWNLYWDDHLQLSILSMSAFPVFGPTYIILFFAFKICYSFRVIDVGYIKALLWRVLFRRLQLIIRNQDLEILWYLGACMPQWQVSSLSTVGLHHSPLIERFHRMFEFNSFIHTRWIVLEYLGSHWHQWWFPSHLLTVTSMTGNQVVSTMFDFNTCNHMVRFVLWATRLKTLDIIFVIQVAMEYV